MADEVPHTRARAGAAGASARGGGAQAEEDALLQGGVPEEPAPVEHATELVQANEFGVSFTSDYEPGGQYEPRPPPPAEEQHALGLQEQAAADEAAAAGGGEE